MVIDLDKNSKESIEYAANEAAKVINKGGVVISPTDTVYGISADIENTKAIEKVYQAKNRDKNKPLLLLVNNEEMLKKYTKKLTNLEKEIIKKYLPGKLTILLLKNDKVPDNITAGSNLVGIRIPDNNDLIQIINKLGHPIISTSANISGQNTITNPQKIDQNLLKYISYIENIGTVNSEPSSIIKIENNQIKIIREEKIAKQIIKDYPNNILKTN